MTYEVENRKWATIGENGPPLAKIDRRWRKLAAAGEKYPKMPKYGEEKVKTIHPKRGPLIRGDSGPKS